MRVTYIKHSGFLAEWADIACLFDWAEGELPEIDPARRLFIFVSHVHADHFTPAIFERCARFPKRTFILSSDIPVDPAREKGENVIRMGPDRRRVLTGGSAGALSAATLGSTDCGVAFVVSYAGKTVYHAGDLHWWAWPDDTPAEERAMKNDYFAQLVKLKGMRLDAAFVPLDPRLGANYTLGFDALMRSVHVSMAFPMHMWDRYEYIEKFCGMPVAAAYSDRIARIEHPLQSFELDAPDTPADPAPADGE